MGRIEKKKGKINYKGIIAILLVIAIAVAIIIFATKKNDNPQEQSGQETYEQTEDGSKYNKSEKLQETKTFYGYEISNIGLSEIEGQTTFNAKIKNVTDKAIGNESIYIVFKTKSGEELYKMQVYVTELKPGKSINVNSSITKEVVESYDIEIVK